MPQLLLIEDNQHMQRIFRERLQREGFQVVTADDGEQGLRRARELHPDIILLDIMLPKLDGFQVLKNLRDDPFLVNVPVFMLSNRSTGNDIQQARSMGARRFFAKGTSALHDIMWHIRNECDYRKILVCTATADAARPIVSALEHPQALCSVVTVFADAVTTASRGVPDVIVIDARPPAASASTVLQQLKSGAATKSLPVVVIQNRGQAIPRADVLVDSTRVAADLRPAVLKLLGLQSTEAPCLDSTPAGIRY